MPTTYHGDDYDGARRMAMLDAESSWRHAADTAVTVTERAIALVIADAFHTEAEAYKTRETKFHVEDEHGVAPALPDLGEAG